MEYTGRSITGTAHAQVLGASADVIAVGKPPTLPVHVSGQYRKNTVAAVLQAERSDLGPLLPVHRLGAHACLQCAA